MVNFRMRARFKNVVVFTSIAVVVPFFWMLLFTNSDGHYEALLEKRFAELHERLQYAESLNKQRENDIHILRSQFTYLLQSLLHNNVTNHSDVAGDLQKTLVNFTDLYGQLSIHLPSIFTYLPHLPHKANSMRPAYRLSKNRFGVSMVFGIPTIKREKISYLGRTLHSLIDGLNEEEKEDCLIVVFIAEPWDTTYVHKIGDEIYKEFKTSIDAGLLEVVAPPSEFYPNLKHLKETFGDSQERVKWRTKQNLDFSFLMLYARSKGIYYTQLEDDVIAKPGYFSIIKTFTQQQKSSNWMLLEFSTLGFIGKLFRSGDLPVLVEFFLMFHADKPIDWLLDHYLTVKVCNPEKDNKHCLRMKADMRRRYKPSLFQHIGMQSSLKGKVQKLKDKYFGKQGLYRAHVNPKADVSTTLRTYQQYTLQKAYLGETFFWALSPQPKNVIKFAFRPPVVIEKFLFRSGNTEHPGDKFVDTTVEILPVSKYNLASQNEENYQQVEEGFLIVAKFNEEGIASSTLSDSLGKIQVLRLRCQSKSESWAILSEIYIKIKAKS